jgi:hypothetical protein
VRKRGDAKGPQSGQSTTGRQSLEIGEAPTVAIWQGPEKTFEVFNFEQTPTIRVEAHGSPSGLSSSTQ